MRTIFAAALAALVAAGCGDDKKSGTPANLPLVKPPVMEATPAGLRPPPPGALSASDLKSRFFQPGPTYVFGLLDAIDSRIAEINQRSEEQDRPCLRDPPVAYDIDVFGETVTFYAQCYDRVTTPFGYAVDPAMFQFAKKDGVTYLYYAIGQGRAAAIVTPVEGAPGEYVVRAWMGVGYLNSACEGCSFDYGANGGSYGAMSLRADSQALTYELAVAGVAIGYCGAQLASDGTNVYAEGSEDSYSCAAPSSVCVAASDVTTPASCGAPLTTFALTPLGRVATTGYSGSYGDSGYPGGSGNTILLDGNPTDSLHFGPSAPTPGVAAF